MPGWPAKILLPRNDIVAKMLLCNPNRPELAASLVQDTFGFRDDEVTGLILIDPNLYPEHEDDKRSIEDFRVLLSRHDIDVEVQVEESPTQDARWLHYLGRMMSGPVKAREEYGKAPKSAIMPITFYSWLPGARYHHWFHFYDPETGLMYPNSPWIRVFELSKLPKEYDGTKWWWWCRFFLSRTAEEFDWLAKQEGGKMAGAVEALKELSFDEKARLRAEAREKWLWDHTARERRSKAEGKVEIARQLLRMKMPLIDITIATSPLPPVCRRPRSSGWRRKQTHNMCQQALSWPELLREPG